MSCAWRVASLSPRAPPARGHGHTSILEQHGKTQTRPTRYNEYGVSKHHVHGVSQLGIGGRTATSEVKGRKSGNCSAQRHVSPRATHCETHRLWSDDDGSVRPLFRSSMCPSSLLCDTGAVRHCRHITPTAVPLSSTLSLSHEPRATSHEPHATVRTVRFRASPPATGHRGRGDLGPKSSPLATGHWPQIHRCRTRLAVLGSGSWRVNLARDPRSTPSVL